MRELIESAAPAAFDVRSWITRFEREAEASVGDRIRIDFDLPDGPTRISADPGELERLLASPVLDVSILMQSSGLLTIHIVHDELEALPAEDEVIDAARYLHLAVEDRGCHTVDTVLRSLLDPLIVVAPQLAHRTGALRWSGKILLEEGDGGSRIIHLLLPYAAERDTGH